MTTTVPASLVLTEVSDASPFADRIEIRVGPAAETLRTLEGPFDLVFIDADGKVVARTSGEISMEQFDQLVAKAQSGKN